MTHNSYYRNINSKTAKQNGNAYRCTSPHYAVLLARMLAAEGRSRTGRPSEFVDVRAACGEPGRRSNVCYCQMYVLLFQERAMLATIISWDCFDIAELQNLHYVMYNAMTNSDTPGDYVEPYDAAKAQAWYKRYPMQTEARDWIAIDDNFNKLIDVSSVVVKKERIAE